MKGIIHKSILEIFYVTQRLKSNLKKSGSAPMFVYFTVHYEKQGTDLKKYPQVFKDNIYIVSYGVDGVTDHVDSDVYDYHRSYEIDKLK